MSDAPAPADAPVTPAPLPMRAWVLGGLGFVVFVSALTLALNAVGVPRLQALVQEAGAFAPLAYILLKALTYVFAPLTSGPIQVFAGTLFGDIWLGTLYTVIGETLGGSISFWIARLLGRPVVARLLGHEGLARVDQLYRERLHGAWSLVIGRLLFFSLWDFLSYAAGFAKVSYGHYVLVSVFIGFIPTLLFVGLGEVLVQDSRTLLALYLLVALAIIVPLWLARLRAKARTGKPL